MHALTRSFVLSALLTAPVAAQCGSTWLESDGYPGTDARINAATVWDPDGDGPAQAWLVLAGEFTVAGTQASILTAAWDGTNWIRMNSGGGGGGARALTVHEGELIAGFDGGVSSWSGLLWSPMGSLGGVKTLSSYGSTLIAGGSNGWRLAKWNGTTWIQFGGANGTVYASAVVGTDLYVGGEFTNIFSTDFGHVARWDGANWHALGSGVDGTVSAIVEYEGDIIVAGGFQNAGGKPAPYVARWDGSEWHSMGTGFNQYVSSLQVIDGVLMAGGYIFQTEEGVGPGHLVWWDGREWRNVGAGIGSPGSNGSSVERALKFNGDLVAVGQFDRAGSEPVSNIARWVGPITDINPSPESGLGWSRIGVGFDGPIEAMAIVKGELVVAGSFDIAGGASARSLAAWDGYGAEGWHGFAQDLGFTNPSWDPDLNAVVEYGGELIVAGRFTRAGALDVNNIARWDGNAWHALGAGLTGDSNATVNALFVHEGDLFAGGTFTAADGATASRVARWDGRSWHGLGDGVGGPVLALGEFDGALVAAGAFTSAGGASANRIATWDGAAWHALGDGLNASVFALAVHERELIAGGSFWEAGGVPVLRVAAWNGSTWHALGSGLKSNVRTLLSFEGSLYAGGDFSASQSVFSHVARWNGAGWVTLGSGIDYGFAGPYTSRVYAMAAFGGEVIVGGQFTRVGTSGGFGNQSASPYFARWGGSSNELVGDVDCSGNVNGADLTALLGTWGTCSECGECAADLNGDCTVNGADLVTVLGNWTGP